MKHLVLLRCSIDDIPLRLFDHEQDAESYAVTLRREDIEPQLELLNLDTSIFHCISIVSFSADGTLVDSVTARNFDSESNCDFPE